MPADFERLATGLYCFGCHELIELKLVDGDTFVFKYGPVDQGLVEEILSRQVQDGCSPKRVRTGSPKSPKGLAFSPFDEPSSPPPRRTSQDSGVSALRSP